MLIYSDLAIVENISWTALHNVEFYESKLQVVRDNLS